jgi:hypothetical protein
MCLLYVSDVVLRAHGCWMSWANMQDVVVNSVMARWRTCSHGDLRYLNPWQRSEVVGEASPPHREASTKMEVFVGSSLDHRDR